MLSENELQPDDVLKVGHHGSHTSSTPAFLDAERPVFAVISVGPDNSYGHPHADVIDRLLDHAVVYRTDLDGLVSIRTDGRRFRISTWHDMAPGLDKLTQGSPAPLVAGPDGKYPVPQPGIVTKREY